jgi:hypothetical protein
VTQGDTGVCGGRELKSRAMGSVTLEPKDPRDVRPEELESLARELRDELASVAPDLDVRVARGDEDHRTAVTFVEVVNAVLEGLGGVSSVIAIKEAIERVAGRWMKRRSAEKNDLRPRSVIVKESDGTQIEKITLENADDDPRVIKFDKKQ